MSNLLKNLKKTIVTVALITGWAIPTSNAQVTEQVHPMLCSSIEYMRNILRKHEEEIIMSNIELYKLTPTSEPEEVFTFLAMNKKTKSWSFIYVKKNGEACMLAAGTAGQLFIGNI